MKPQPLLFAMWLVPGAVLADEKPGQLRFEAVVDETPAEGCTAKVVKAGAVARGDQAISDVIVEGGAGPLEVPPGKVDALVECTVDGVKYLKLVENIAIKAGKDSTEKVVME